MSKFITGDALINTIDNIIWKAENTLLIVSPYIKLDDYFKKLFNNHKNNPKVHLLLVFGKNENAVKKSLSKSDLEYFQEFPNVSIIYAPNLHAKYYGNEKQGVITSINLYDYSFKNNIEFGVSSQQSIFDRFSQSADNDAWNECMEIAEKNEVVFIKRPMYQSKKLIIKLGKNYIKSDVLSDSTDKFYYYGKETKAEKKHLNDFPRELELGSSSHERPTREVEEESNTGYCIRTGEEIDFNPQRPMSKESWKLWYEYKNEDYPEKYCHKTGKLSKGKTTMRNPIM